MGMFRKIEEPDNPFLLFLTKHPRLADALERVQQSLASLGGVASAAEIKARYTEIAGGPQDGESRTRLLALIARCVQLVFGINPWPHQLVGALCLTEGKIVELPNGEGKTLMAAMAACLYAPQGQVHIATANDYLVSRDAYWMFPLYDALGLSVGVLLGAQTSASRVAAILEAADHSRFIAFDHAATEEKRRLFACRILYSTIEELGFAFLREHLAKDKEDLYTETRDLLLADEADYVLLDRLTDDIFMHSAVPSKTLYHLGRIWQLARSLVPGVHFSKDLLDLTPEGLRFIEEETPFGDLYSRENVGLAFLLNRALTALVHFERDDDYVVEGGQIIPIDGITGRLLYSSRYPGWLHEALLLKEGLAPHSGSEQVPVANITIKNLLKQYRHTAGMTGYADLEDEYLRFYRLEVVRITPREKTREELPDLVYVTEGEKLEAAAEDIAGRRAEPVPRPILVNVPTLPDAEKLSSLLQQRNVPHRVLNALNHRAEAEIIQAAGEIGSVLISVKLAGRGTDIVLSEAAKAAGGLHVIGIGRNESRRLDEQLCGRTGRHGNPGSCQFFISIEDGLMQAFGSSQLKGFLRTMGQDYGEAIESRFVDRAIKRAQAKLLLRAMAIRSRVVRFDDVLERHRTMFYYVRRGVLCAGDARPYLRQIVDNFAQDRTAFLSARDFRSEKALRLVVTGLQEAGRFLAPVEIDQLRHSLSRKAFTSLLSTLLYQKLDAALSAKHPGPAELAATVRGIILAEMDSVWSGHLAEAARGRDEAGVYDDAVDRMFASYLDRMELRFDDLFLQIGARVVARLAQHSLS